MHALNQISWLRTAEINLLIDSASVTFEGKKHLSDIIIAIEDVGYEATLGQAKELEKNKESTAETHSEIWRAFYAISGMTCSSCVGTITKALQQHD